MKIQTLPRTMNREEAMKNAEKRGNVFGKLTLKNEEITLKLMYFESKEIIFNMTYQDNFFQKMFRKNKDAPPNTQKIRIIAEGTRGTPAFLPYPLKTVEVEVDDPSLIQNSEMPIEKIISDSKFLARKMVRRQKSRIVHTEVDTITSIYRPYYVAFYGEYKEGNKVRYLTIPADGNVVKRTN